MNPPRGRVLIVAASDSGGGAGIQADLKTVLALGGYGMTAVTALTAQNTLGIFAVHPVPAEFVALQMRVVLEDLGADIVKIGMLGSEAIVDSVAALLDDPLARDIPVVLDPVVQAKAGVTLLDSAALAAMKRRLIPRAFLLTPNAPEAEILTGSTVRSEAEMPAAAEALRAQGARNVLLKGGHLPGATVTDLLAGPDGQISYRHPRIDTVHTHGTGCTLASAIATLLAQGVPLAAAVERAGAYVEGAIRAAPGFGRGHGPLGHGWHVAPGWPGDRTR
jgi:hydroxymethylpyrimidine/phosphomethylpyrimidine kinase